MRAEGLKRGLVSISLVFAIVLSMTLSITFTATPVLTQEWWGWENVISEPGGTTIDVDKGQEFVLSFRLEWGEPEDGRFAIVLKWFSPENNPAENFTIVGVSAYFDNDQTINAAVTREFEGPWDNGTLYTRTVGTPVGDDNNGPFNVDITFLAGSEGFAHIPGTHTIEIEGTILVAEKLPWLDYMPPDPVITIKVLTRGVAVEISPSKDSGPPGETLTYTVTVTNTGDVADNYDLITSDNASWSISLDNDRFEDVENGGSRSTTLSVTIPEDAPTCTRDNITVRVTGTGVENSASCVAHALILRSVELVISPSYQTGSPESVLEYTITVSNTGNVEDNYDLRASDNENWSPTVMPALLTVPAGENRVATLSVTVSENAVPCTEDNIIVTATSQGDNTVENSASCIAHVEAKCGVDVTIEPKHQRGTPGTELTFFVTVHNTGNIEDNYLLWVEPDGWPMENIYFEDDVLENVDPGETRRTFLYVHIPDNALPCTHKEIVVWAESEFCGATDNDNALVQVVSKYLHNVEPGYPLDPHENWVCWTTWHEIYPNYSQYYHLSSWEDNNMDNMISPCDQIDLTNLENENDITWYHVKDMTITIFISKKTDPTENMYLEFEGGFENMENTITWPVGTQWHEIYPNFCKRYRLISWEDTNHDDKLSPCDQIEMMDKDTGEMAEYHVDEVATDIVLCEKPSVVIVRGVDVSISPSYQENLPGENLTYIVTVANTGNVDENYDLRVSDNAHWEDNIRLDDNTLTVPASENRTTTLHVHIPENAVPCTEDNITVTATSQADNMVENSASCVAHALILRSVELVISPSYQTGSPGSALDYTIRVSNTGNVGDTYDLTASDNKNWGPTVSPTSLTVPAGENRAATLSVTIPSNVALGTEDTITVTATSRENAEISASDTCVAYAGLVIYPTHDAYVWRQYRDNNYNTKELKIGAYDDNSVRAWLRFDLSDIPFGHRVESARLWLYFKGSVGLGALGGIEAHFSSDDSWLEEEITWNDQPPFDDEASDRILWFTDIGWKSLTLTQDVGRELDSDKKVSWCLKSPEDVIDRDHNIAHSKEYENALYRPYLEIVHVPFYGVSISISPRENSARPGENLTFTVTVKNMGAFDDTYSLSAVDTLNWNLTISPTELSIASAGSDTATLSVTVPENAPGSTEYDITVKATSAGDETKSDSAVCVARASTIIGVEVSVSPGEDNGVPGTTLSYTVVVRNTGTVADNYFLSVDDNAVPSWGPTLSKNLFENVAPGQDRTATLTVTIPGNAAHCTRDNMRVTATSQADNAVSASASCIAHAAIVRGVEAEISPGHKSGVPEATLNYTVTITNTGNVEENYQLTISDNAGWGPTLSLTSLTVPAGDSRATMLSLTIPSGAEHGEKDKIQVVAASAEVSASASCEAEVSILMRVEVSISPGSGSGEPGTSLTYSVTVRNTGLIDDTYTLRAVGKEGWSVSIEPDSLTIAAGASDNATLRVVISPDAPVGDSMTTYVNVQSGEDSTVISTDTCRTVVTGAEEGPELELPVPLAISVVLIGAAIIVPTYLLRERRKKAARRRVLSFSA